MGWDSTSSVNAATRAWLFRSVPTWVWQKIRHGTLLFVFLLFLFLLLLMLLLWVYLGYMIRCVRGCGCENKKIGGEKRKSEGVRFGGRVTVSCGRCNGFSPRIPLANIYL